MGDNLPVWRVLLRPFPPKQVKIVDEHFTFFT